MLKNDIRYIIKRVLVGVLIAICIFLLKSQGVLAAELASTSGYRVNYSTGTATGTSSCVFSGTISNSGLIQAGTGFSNTTSGSCQYYRSVGINLQTPSDTSKQFEPGVQYTLKFLWNFNPRPTGLAFDDTITPQVYNGSSYVDSALVQITSWSTVVASDNYGVYVTINFTVTSRQRYIIFLITPLNMSVSPNFYFFRYYQQGINIKNFELTESNDEIVNSIDNQTTIISNLINDFKANFMLTAEEQLAYLQDDSDPNVDVSGMSGITGILPAGPIDSLLSLPITILNIFIDSTSGTCTPLTFTFVFNEQFTIPCFDTIWNQVPTGLMLFISDLPAALLFVYWAKSVYKRVERATTFESTVDDEWGGI